MIFGGFRALTKLGEKLQKKITSKGQDKKEQGNWYEIKMESPSKNVLQFP